MEKTKEFQTRLRYLRLSPRKVRRAAKLLQGRSVKKVQEYLEAETISAEGPLRKLLKSAVANAKHNHGLGPEKLFIKRIQVDGGPVLKRFMPRAFGRAFPIKKRSSHITIVLEER